MDDIGTKWVAGWSSRDSDAFAKLYAPDGEYVDHAFCLCRSGRAAVRKHHELWWKAVPDFVMTLERTLVSDRSIIVQVVGEGTFSGEDLGGGKMKATGKRFSGRLVAILDIDEFDRIATSTEYYDKSIMPGGSVAGPGST